MKIYFMTFILSVFLFSAHLTVFAQPEIKRDNKERTRFTLPPWQGRYNVGRQLYYWTNYSMIHGENNTESGRTLAVWVYYPSGYSDKRKEDLFSDKEWKEKHKEFIKKRYGEEASIALAEAETDALTGIPVLRENGKLPLLIFAPGYSWLPLDYSIMIEELASRGYIVAAFASPGVASVIMNPSRSFITVTGFSEYTYRAVADDFLFVKDRMRQLAENHDDIFNGIIDIERTGFFGHSISGAAAVVAAAEDKKVKAACNLDGDYSGSFSVYPSQPLLYITSQPFNIPPDIPADKWDEDRSEGRRKKVWESVKSNSVLPVRIRVIGMYHSNFQDAAIMPRETLPKEALEKRLGKIDGKRGLILSADLIDAFFKRNLYNTGSDFVLNAAKQYPEVITEIPEIKAVDGKK